jgi:hypothetical protein
MTQGHQGQCESLAVDISKILEYGQRGRGACPKKHFVSLGYSKRQCKSNHILRLYVSRRIDANEPPDLHQ